MLLRIVLFEVVLRQSLPIKQLAIGGGFRIE